MYWFNFAKIIKSERYRIRQTSIKKQQLSTDLTNIDDELQESEELYERLVIEVPKGQDSLRIDKFLMTKIEGATRNKIQQGIDNEMVLVNDKPVKSNYKVRPYDKIVVFDNKNPETTDIIPEKIPLNIGFEDDDIFIINKPVGMVVHPGSCNDNGP